MDGVELSQTFLEFPITLVGCLQSLLVGAADKLASTVTHVSEEKENLRMTFAFGAMA